MKSSSDTAARWTRIGRVLAGPGDVSWASTHAALPVVESGPAGRLQVHFAARDEHNCARIGRVEVDPQSWKAAGRVSPQPLLDVGRPGTFDDHGVTSSWIVAHQGRRYHYYTGWTLGRTVPFHLFVGLAVSDAPDDRPRRMSAAPVLDRCDVDPYLTASPCVLIEDGVWRMWYVSGVGWRGGSNALQPEYHIKYAESRDGVVWQRPGVVCIDFASPDEHAIARPCVVKDADRYRMWFCCRGAAYRIGYAESRDGLVWDRNDDAGGLRPAAEGWDSEMTAYPFVFDHAGARYMFYNGNGFGASGFGVASWK